LYQLLGLLCHSFGQPEFALKHFLRAKYINELICGSDHPDTALILANIASMYQEMGDNHKCFAYMEKAIAMNERVLGIDHLQTATTYHSIALMYGMIQKPKIALDYEKKNYRILVNKFGIQDLRVMESSQWLEMFTGKAVKAQKEIKKETLATQLKKQKFMNQN
jgi:protein TIF31